MSPHARSRRRWLLRGAAPALAAALFATSLVRRAAEAKNSFESPYTLAQTYNAALRLVRVDLGLVVTERDPAAAYLLFEYRSTESGGRSVPGSIEILEAGRAVKVVVQLGQMPRYHEQVLSDALARKLRDEYGEPGRKPKPEPTDGGAAGGPPE